MKINLLCLITLAYLIGSISFAVLISKIFSLADPRTYGSKNPGATNVLRSGNKTAAILTLIGDCFKGWIVIWLIQKFYIQLNIHEINIAFVIIAVFAGHLWPLFFHFTGGKGVSTALGILLAIDTRLALITLITWSLIVYISGYVSLAAVISSLCVPFYYELFFKNTHSTGGIFFSLFAISIILIIRHKTNIIKLLAGQEHKICIKKNHMN